MSTTTKYLDAVRTNVEDVFDAWDEAALYWEDAARRWADDPQHAFAPVRGRKERTGPSDRQGCGCGERTDDCCDECQCCVPAADIVLHTRVGETRVIPFRLRNTWRRPREVTLAVGQWQLCQGERLDVRAVFEAPETLTLEPCSAEVVRLIVAIHADGNPDPHPDKGQEEPVRGRLTDVSACTSLFTDVRFEGCARPQRVAVVIHPAHCVAIEPDCNCGCCG